MRILHVCGGDPYTEAYNRGLGPVFSTYVEVILIDGSAGSATYGILHVCGGDPYAMFEHKIGVEYSPRMWR